MLFMFSATVVICVAAEWAYKVLMENSHEVTKEIMNLERLEYNVNRQKVIRGIFRQHNQQFRDNGFNPPKGTA